MYKMTINERFNMIGLSESISRVLLVILVNFSLASILIGYKGRNFQHLKFARIVKKKMTKIFDVANHKIKDSQIKNFCLFKIVFYCKKKKKMIRESLLILFCFLLNFNKVLSVCKLSSTDSDPSLSSFLFLIAH